MCQLRHPNIVSADDVYFSTDIAPSANASSAARAQDVFVRMPYYPADLAWLIHSSPQVLTSAHIQVRQCLHQRQRRSVCAHSRTFLLRRSTFWFKCCAACGDCRSRCASLGRARLTCALQVLARLWRHSSRLEAVQHVGLQERFALTCCALVALFYFR